MPFSRQVVLPRVRQAAEWRGIWGEDAGSGINVLRLVKHMLGQQEMRDAELVWAYERLKAALRLALDQVPSLDFFEGD